MEFPKIKLLIFLLIFLGIGALYGGGSLIIDPSGELLGMPLTMLESSPFNNFLLPGVILFLLLGVAPLLVGIALKKKTKSDFAERFNCFKDMHWSWSYTIYIGFYLIMWIQVQEIFINGAGWIHGFYIFLAILIIFVALLPWLRDQYKQ